MIVATPSPHDIWLGSAIIARALKDGLDNVSARAWFNPGEEFDHVCAMMGKSPAAVLALADGVFARPDAVVIVDRLVRASTKNTLRPQRPTINQDDEDTAPVEIDRELTRTYTYNGKSVTAEEYAELTWIRPAPTQGGTPPRYIAYKGETLTMSQWSKRTGVARKSISKRLNCGWTTAEALGFVPRRADARKVPQSKTKRYTHSGKSLTLCQWARELNTTTSTLYRRIEAGWSHDELFSPMRTARRYRYNGRSLTVRQLAHIAGVDTGVMRNRLRRRNVEEAIGKIKSRGLHLRYQHGDQCMTLAAWSRHTGIPYVRLHARIRRGWSFLQAIGVEPRNVKTGRKPKSYVAPGVCRDFADDRPDRTTGRAQHFV